MTYALVATIIGCIGTSIGVRLRSKEDRLAYRMMRQGVAARRFCHILNIHVKASNDTKVSPRTLRVANHLTVFDPIILASQLDVCFAGKAEIGRWPIIGWICKCYAILLVERGRKAQAKTFAFQIRERLNQGGSVLVFPEGTTGDGIALLPFKTGAFESIRDWEKGRLQPIFVNVIAVNGSAVHGLEGRMALTKTSPKYPDNFIGRVRHLASFRRLDIELQIGPFLNTTGMDRRALSNLARDTILAFDRNNQSGSEQRSGCSS